MSNHVGGASSRSNIAYFSLPVSLKLEFAMLIPHVSDGVGFSQRTWADFMPSLYVAAARQRDSLNNELWTLLRIGPRNDACFREVLLVHSLQKMTRITRARERERS